MPWLLFSISLLSVLALVEVPAEAQGRRPPRYQIYDWRGKVGFQVRHEKDIRDASGQPLLDTDEWTISEEIAVGADGWLYHPALLLFGADVGAIFNQDFVQSSGDETSQVEAFQLNFNVDVNLLPRKPYPIHLFASQVHAEISSPFVPQRTIDTLRYGAALRLSQLAVGGWKIPTRLRYRHLDSDTRGPFGSTRAQDDVELVMDNETENSRNQLEYDWNLLRSDTGGSSRSTTRQDLRLFQDYYLDRGLLSSHLLASDYSGDDQLRAVALNETLRLEHGPSLTSNYAYALNYLDSEGSRNLANRGSIGLTHQLYESLSSSANVGAGYSDSDLGQIWDVMAGLGFYYNKRIPGGSFGLRFLPVFTYQDEDVVPGLVSVPDEEHRTVFSPPIVLDNFNVFPESIVVRDAVRPDIVFTLGVDYNVVPEGISTLLIIIPTGRINPIETPILSVQYDYLSEPARTFTTWTLASGFNLSLWDHVSFDISYTKINIDLLKGVEEDSTLSDEERLFSFLAVNFKHNRTQLEYERVRSRINPRERYGASHTLDFRPTARSTVGFGAQYNHDRLTDSGRVSQSYGANANGTAWLPFWVLGQLSLFVRQLDEVEQDALAVGAVLALTYRYGSLRFRLQERFDWVRTNAKLGEEQRTKEIYNSLLFRVERPF